MKINKTYTLRFVKLPPATIAAGKPFDIIFSLTDDLGLELPCYPDVEVTFSVEGLHGRASGYRVEDQASKSDTVTIGSSRSLLHKRTLILRAEPPTRFTALDKAFLVLKLGENPQSEDLSVLDPRERTLMHFVQVNTLLHLEDDEMVALVVPTYAGPFDIVASKTNEHSRERVTTTEVHLACENPVRIVERPLDKVVGDHLWHSSVILASLILQGSLARPGAENVVELGAGCGLVSLALQEALRQQSSKRIIATDLSEVVETTLQETLLANNNASPAMEMQALEWSNAKDTARLLDYCQGRNSLWLVAADVLYNPGSHEALLQTIRDICRSFKTYTVTIAYRPRTAGDDTFFALASNKGLFFKLVLQLADIQIWEYSFA